MLHKFWKQQQSVAASGKLSIGGKFSVAVTNKYAIGLKGNETLIKLDNGIQVSMMLETVLCPIKTKLNKQTKRKTKNPQQNKTTPQRARDIQVKFRHYTDKPVNIKGL